MNKTAVAKHPEGINAKASRIRNKRPDSSLEDQSLKKLLGKSYNNYLKEH